MMYQIVGIEKKEFTFNDGKTVSGVNLYLTQQRNKVEGYACERVFVSDTKLDGYVPKLSDHIELYYNRFGKVQELRRV